VFTFAVCAFITAVPITKLFAGGGGGVERGGHVLRSVFAVCLLVCEFISKRNVCVFITAVPIAKQSYGHYNFAPKLRFSLGNQ
jgi:hypothetical protein